MSMEAIDCLGGMAIGIGATLVMDLSSGSDCVSMHSE
jgi:hypothetical protein